MEDGQAGKASLESSATTSVGSEQANQADFRVHHVLQLVEVPGGDEQKGLYARVLNVTGGRTKVGMFLSEPISGSECRQ